MARRCRALARDRGRSLRHTEGDRSRSRTGACQHPWLRAFDKRPSANSASSFASNLSSSAAALFDGNAQSSNVGYWHKADGRPYERALPLIADKRNSPGQLGECVDGSQLARRIFTSQAWSVQPCVRPVSAVRMTAGHNALRGIRSRS